MILVDTGPLIALFDPRDAHHSRCKNTLARIRDSLVTTIPVLTEAFHMLHPASNGSNNLRDFVLHGGLHVWFMDSAAVRRTFELMERYADHPMDLADGSLIVAAEQLGTRSFFTIDRRDFSTYLVLSGHRYYPAEILD